MVLSPPFTPSASSTPPERRDAGWLGFSLIEMLIVLSVLGILLAMSIPKVANQVEHSRVNNATAMVVSDLQRAVSVAQRARQPMTFEFDSLTNSYSLRRRDGTTVDQRRFAFGKDTRDDFRNVMLRVTPVRADFLPDGTVGNKLTVSVSTGSYQHQITVSRGGLVRMTQ
jgi:prepilin-type N-terminal cleavage/methylation domain-containing protein